MGCSRNIPKGHQETHRFTRKEPRTLPPHGVYWAIQVSFFTGYEAGQLTRYVGCVYMNCKGRLSFWSRACNGRNRKWYEDSLADVEADEEYEETTLDELATKSNWLSNSAVVA